MKKIYTFFVLVFLSVSLTAQWQQISGTNITGMVDYDNIIYTGNSVLLINEAGVYRSDDNGVTWILSVEGLDSTNLSVDEIVYIAGRNEVWLTSRGNVFKSTNYGKTWKRQELAGLTGIGWIRQIGRIQNRLIVAFSEFDPGIGKDVTTLYYSSDGTAWTKGAKVFEGRGWLEFIHSFNNKFLGIIFDPQNDTARQFLFSETGSDIGTFPLTGLGANPEMDQDNFSVDPSGDYLFYRYRDETQKKIYRYNFTAKEWEEKMKGFEFAPFTLAEIFRVNSLGGHVFASALFTDMVQIHLKLFYSHNNGDNWTLVPSPGVDLPVFEKEMVIAGSNRIIGSYFNNLMAYSDNIGQTWTPITNVNAGEFNNLVALNDGNIYTKSPDQLRGILKSSDNGSNWTIHNGDLPNFMGIYLIGSLFPGGPDVMYATAQDNPFQEKQELFKSTDYGAHWVKVTTAPDSAIKWFLGMHGTGNPIMFFRNREGRGTYQYTTNQGATWNNITGISALGIDKVMGIRSNGTLMILFAEKEYKVRVYKSTNNGGSFTDITANLDVPNLNILVADRWAWDRNPSAVAGFNSSGTSFVVAVMDWNWPVKVTFYALNGSQDGWNKIGTGGIEVPYNFECLTLRHDGKVWYLVSTVGVYTSIDNCENWLRLWNNEGYVMGLMPRTFLRNPYGVFIGTKDGGLWRAPIKLPVLTTNAVTEITETTAKSGGDILSTGGLPFHDKGLVYSVNPNPGIPGSSTMGCGNSWDDFTGVIYSLTPNTTYYVRAYVSSQNTIVYGNERSFTTLNPTGIIVHKPGEVYLYPNPSNGLFNVVADDEISMTVMNVIGKVVLSSPVYNGINVFELKNQPAGIYFVRLEKGGKTLQTIRLILK